MTSVRIRPRRADAVRALLATRELQLKACLDALEQIAHAPELDGRERSGLALVALATVEFFERTPPGTREW